MEQRCKIILQNYLKTQEYNNDYKIIIYNNFINNSTNFVIKYTNITLFYVFDNNNYIKYNIYNNIIKLYNHNNNFYYSNNKNYYIYFYKNQKIKVIYNDIENKYYDKFYKMYKKTINIYNNFVYFEYYYIKSFIYICIYKTNINYYNKTKLYSKHYSIMFLL